MNSSDTLMPQLMNEKFEEGCTKLSTVLRQLKSRRVHMCGLQEMRAYTTGISVCEGLIVCRSAVDKIGGHGCGIVFNRSIPWFTKDKVEIPPKRNDVAIEFADPRC